MVSVIRGIIILKLIEHSSVINLMIAFSDKILYIAVPPVIISESVRSKLAVQPFNLSPCASVCLGATSLIGCGLQYFHGVVPQLPD